MKYTFYELVTALRELNPDLTIHLQDPRTNKKAEKTVLVKGDTENLNLPSGSYHNDRGKTMQKSENLLWLETYVESEHKSITLTEEDEKKVYLDAMERRENALDDIITEPFKWFISEWEQKAGLEVAKTVATQKKVAKKTASKSTANVKSNKKVEANSAKDDNKYHPFTNKEEWLESFFENSSEAHTESEKKTASKGKTAKNQGKQEERSL